MRITSPTSRASSMKAAEQHADRAHAVLSASSADRWLNCTPSARMGEGEISVQSDYADEGTLAHEISETVLLQLTNRIQIKEIKARMKIHAANKHYYVGIYGDVQPYVDLVLEQLNSAPDNVLLLEQRLDFSEFVEQGFGTGDSVVVSPSEGILYVTDLKFGRGVRVSAVDNSQLKLYGIGALQEHGILYPIHTVRLTVCQPRIDNTSTWDISVEDLLDWAENTVKPTAELAFKGEGEVKTGDWCKFCKAKLKCPAINGEVLTIAQQDFSAIDAMPHEDAEEGLLEIYHMAGRIRTFLDDVEAHIFRRAMSGHKFPGLKIVYGRSRREITDEDGALQLLLDAGYPEEQITKKGIVGIKALEKLLGDDFDVLADYVHKPIGKPTLTLETDNRSSINRADDFND